MTKRDELIALGGVVMKVRELGWVEMPDRDPESASWIAETDLGRSYRVFAAWWGAQNKYGYVFDGFYHTENEAKAAAQSDYEQRIRSALIATPVAAGVRDILEKIACHHVTVAPLWWQIEARNALSLLSDDGGCICQNQHRRGYCTEPGCTYNLSGTTPSAPSVAVKAKALTWRDHRPDSFPEPAWSAETPFGFYRIEEVSASDSPAYVVRLHAHHFIADKDSLEEAKTAAQADYERRILSALEAPAAGDGEPVAWQTRIMFDKGSARENEWGPWRDCPKKWYEHTKVEIAAGATRLEARALYTTQPADAAMREALQKCVDAWDALPPGRYPDTAIAKWMNDTVWPAIEAWMKALTAPGATTKSDGGVEGHARDIADSGRASVRGDNGAPESPHPTTAGIKPGPSEPSSTRSEVTALADIAAERERQREVEGWSSVHDDGHDTGEMAGAAACYALSTIKHWAKDQVIKLIWPWADEWWKPKDARRNLVKAGALIVAEIERLDRLDQFEIRRK